MMKLVLLIIAISSDAFICMLEKGATFTQESFNNKYIYTFIFTLVSLFMVSFGFLVGNYFINEELSILYRFNVFLITIIISLYLFINTFRRQSFFEHRDNCLTYKKCLKIAVLSCLDICLIGVTLSTYSYPLISLLTCVITFIVVLTAITIGYYYGANYQKAIGTCASLIYFVIANYQLYNILISL